MAFSRKIYHEDHKERWIDYQKLIEEEHLKTDLAFLDYEEKEDEETLAPKIFSLEKENAVELVLTIAPSSSTDVGPFEPPLNVVNFQEKVRD